MPHLHRARPRDDPPDQPAAIRPRQAGRPHQSVPRSGAGFCFSAGFADTRFADGVVFQHLVAGPVTISTFADKLGVTQQAASKTVADLQQRRYVARRADPADARAKQVHLTDHGQAVIGAARKHRAALDKQLRDALADQRVEDARLLLVDVINRLGASPTLRARAVRPPH